MRFRIRSARPGIFFTHHKDALPSTDSGVMQTIWSYAGAVPTCVWLLAAAGALLFVALNSRSSILQITESVKTGARQ
jgi:hypothetical protein